MDDYFTDLNNDPEIMQEGFGVVDLSISYDDDDKGYRVSLYGRNVTDEEYFEFAANVGGIDCLGWCTSKLELHSGYSHKLGFWNIFMTGRIKKRLLYAGSGSGHHKLAEEGARYFVLTLTLKL